MRATYSRARAPEGGEMSVMLKKYVFRGAADLGIGCFSAKKSGTCCKQQIQRVAR